jgi:pimeloyl-ACP methyl ester carboxylesterase
MAATNASMRRAPRAADALTVVWLHGSPQTGALLEPLVSAAVGHGIRLLSYDRPGYGASSRKPGRQVASIYLQGIDPEEILSAVRARRAPMMSASAGLRL